MKLLDLLQGIDFAQINTEPLLETFINAKASELKAKILIDDGEKDIYVPKTRLDEEIGKKKAITTQLDKVNSDMEAIKVSHKDDALLTKTINDLQAEKVTLDGKLKQQTIDSVVRLRALSASAKDETGSDVLTLIDKTKFVLNDDGTVNGVDDAIKALQESKPYLFGDVEKGGTGSPGKGKKTPVGAEGMFGKQLADEQSAIINGAEVSRASFFK